MTLLYFAWLRERMGRGQEQLPCPEGVATIGALMDWLQARDDAGARAFGTGVIRAALNEEFASRSAPVTDADTVAFFPPVTGG